MELFLFLCMLVVLVVRWFQMRDRLAVIESRLDSLSERVYGPPTARLVAVPPPLTDRMPPPPESSRWQASGPPPEQIRTPQPPVLPRPGEESRSEESPVASGPPPEQIRTPQPPVLPRPGEESRPEESPVASGPPPEQIRTPYPPAAPQPTPPRTSEDWEALLGGSWLNKIGVFVVVIGIALLLNYAYTYMGPAGRVAVSYAGALAMLSAGFWLERQERYRIFAYGLIGGGWAALYLTTYAIHAIEAARILDNPVVSVVLLLAVAAAMIAHSLRYRSETVTGLAYFLAFVTLAISEVTAFSVLALLPLAASLLFVAYRNQWSRFALFGLIATYVTVGMHKDTGAPLWQTQAIFLLYWLLFEGFDLIRSNRWLLPLNTIGFVLLSGVKWSHAAPESGWMFAAGSASLYLASTIVRAHSGRWRSAVTVNAALAVAAMALKLEHEWLGVGLLALAQVYYLAGLRFRSTYLRVIAAVVFGLELLYLLVELIPNQSQHPWEPLALATAAAFYLNRVLRPADVVYGYLGAGLAVLVSGNECSEEWRGRVWTLMAAVPFTIGWCRRQVDFRIQAYGLLALGGIAMASILPPPASLAVLAAAAYALVQCALRSGPDRFYDTEREAVRFVAACAATLALAVLIWRLVPGEALGAAWLALAAAMLEAGLRGQPREFRWQAYLVAVLGTARALLLDANTNFALAEAVLLYGIAWRARQDLRGRVTDAATFPAAILLLAGSRHLLPEWSVTACWALIAMGMAEFDRRTLQLQSMLVAAAVFARAILWDLHGAQPLAAVIPAIVVLEAAMWRRPLGSRMRMYFSLLAAVTGAALIYQEVSGSVLTIAWGIEGVALLAAGFPLRDRVLRLSGLAMLAVCTGKLFFWDLRNLETLPRILSFIVLGVLLVAVSWVYTRFRELVRRIL